MRISDWSSDVCSSDLGWARSGPGGGCGTSGLDQSCVMFLPREAPELPPRSERRTDVTDWNLGDILDAIEPAMPHDAPALIHGDRIITWPEMSARSTHVEIRRATCRARVCQ